MSDTPTKTPGRVDWKKSFYASEEMRHKAERRVDGRERHGREASALNAGLGDLESKHG